MKANQSVIRRGYFLSIISFIILIGYLLALSGYYFSPAQWAAGGVFNPGFVYAWVVMSGCMIAWFFRNKIWAFFFLVLLAAGVPPLSVSFSVGTATGFQREKSDATIRIMQWNCEDIGGNLSWYTEKNIGRKRAADFIREYNPDVICMQDYSDFRGNIYKSNESFFRDTLGYPHNVFALHVSQVKPYGVIKSGLKIVSKYPIEAHGVYYYKNISVPEAILWADIMVNQTRLRVVTTHFRSYYLSGNRIFSDQLPNYMHQDSSIVMENNVIEKLVYFQKQHTQQAAQLRAFLDTCSVPVILCADLNTVPSSHLYQLVRGNMEDGYMGNETGLGATYNYLLPNIRIDYIFHHPLISLFQWKHFKDGFFDHDHLLGDYSIPKPN